MAESSNNHMKGYFNIVYSPDDGGYYAELWWNDEHSPVFTKASDAREWALEHGGEAAKER